MQSALCTLGNSWPGTVQGPWAWKHLWLQHQPWWGSSPTTAVVQEPCTSQSVVKTVKTKACFSSGKLVLGSSYGRTVIPHPLPVAWRAQGPASGQSAVGVSSRWVCAACYMVYPLFHSLSLLGKRAVFLAFSPRFTAIYLYRVFTLASVITKEIVQYPLKSREKKRSKHTSDSLAGMPTTTILGKIQCARFCCMWKWREGKWKHIPPCPLKMCTYRVEATTSDPAQTVFLLPGRSVVGPESFNLSYV